MAGIWANEDRASASGTHGSTAPRVGLGEPARRPRERRRLARHRRLKHERDAAHRRFAGRCHRHRPDANALRTSLDDSGRAYRRVSGVSAGAGTNSHARGGLGRFARCRGVHYRVGMGRPRGGNRRCAVRRHPSTRRHLTFTRSGGMARRPAAARHIAGSSLARCQPASGGGRASLRRCDSRCSAFRALGRCS